ncbi:MAG TPA: signal peptidase I [Abditibacteriaceae bacterium]
MNEEFISNAVERESEDSPPEDTSPGEAPQFLPAGFWLRAGAKMVDFLVLIFLQLLLFGAVALAHSLVMPNALVFWLLLLGTLVLNVFFFAFFTSNDRQTPGYRLSGLRVKTREGAPVAFKRSTQRAIYNMLFWLAIYIVVGAFNYLRVAWHRGKRTWHDDLSDTQVVRVATPHRVGLTVGFLALVAFVALPTLFLERALPLKAYFLPSGAMENTLRIHDRILVNKMAPSLRGPRLDEIWVFTAPETSGSGGQDFIKRCIGVPGHIVEVKKTQVYRDGKATPEPHVKWEQPPGSGSYGYDMKIVDDKIYSREYIMAPDTPGLWEEAGTAPRLPADNQDLIEKAKAESVPPGQLLMLGDNRLNSNDSHAWGFVPRSNLKGVAALIYWPPGRFQGL